MLVEDFGRMLAIKEVAAVLCVGRDSVVRLIKRGALKCIEFPRMGGSGKNVKRMVSEKELRHFMGGGA
jgi:predicted DNA-binding transcriptional regulator AlpA